MIKICNQKDCPLHPDYINPHNVKSDIMLNNTINGSDIFIDNAFNDSTIRFQTEFISCYAECMFCKHRIDLDMKQEIMIQKAKTLLGE